MPEDLQPDSSNRPEPVPIPATSLLDESPVTREARLQFTARCEFLRPGFKLAVKAPNGFVTAFVFAEAKRARDAGNFTAAHRLLDELDELIHLALKREEQKIRKAGEKFDADFKFLERKARGVGGAILQSALRHLKAARVQAGGGNFVRANRELRAAEACFHPAPPPADSGKSRSFTIRPLP
jgi:hypothetical protein